LCGEVAYEIHPPFLFFQYCHCSRCRKSSGSAHGASLFLKRDQFGWTRGEAVVKRYELPGAQYFCTGFCPICGASMPWVSRNGKYVLVPAGTLDDDPGVQPQRSIFWESRAPWYVEVGTLPTFAQEG
jgi:hypothetical protein